MVSRDASLASCSADILQIFRTIPSTAAQYTCLPFSVKRAECPRIARKSFSDKTLRELTASLQHALSRGMPFSSSNDTICAIATPPGIGGLGVVRISGPRSLEILKGLWGGGVSVDRFEPRRCYLIDIRVEASGSNHNPVLDKVLAIHMPGPKTYTGDDVVELSCHGSPFLLRSILESCVSLGARNAMPGEFTRRAFLAGKLDLVQAEAVSDLIAATSERAVRIASEHLSGRLSHEITSLGDALASLRADIEAAIDFSEEGLSPPERTSLIKRIEDILDAIHDLRVSFRGGLLIRDGLRVAIVGRPNVGKSSILNCLVGHERAIVHHEPGTTRDVVEEEISFEGLRFRLRDTAGLRGCSDVVESLGMERARSEITLADCILAVFDGSRAWDEEDAALLLQLEPKKTIVAINKSDLPLMMGDAPLRKWSSSEPPLCVSAISQGARSAILSRLASFSHRFPGIQEGVSITNARHHALLGDAAQALEKARSSSQEGIPIECVASHLCAAQDALGGITGAVTTEEILDRIFSRFCIGK